MQEMWIPSLGWEDPLEQDMATRFSILAREIPWTEAPGGQYTAEQWGRREVKPDVATKQQTVE